VFAVGKMKLKLKPFEHFKVNDAPHHHYSANSGKNSSTFSGRGKSGEILEIWLNLVENYLLICDCDKIRR
jgi:hypothetical protein